MDETRDPGLFTLALIYLFFLLLSVSSYGDPFPFLGKVFTGKSAHVMAFADSLISLYLFLGIVKRQFLTWWLLILYNVLDIVNALLNLFLISTQEYEGAVGAAIPEQSLQFNTLTAALALVLLNVFIFRRRRCFNNRSLYLF